MPATRATARTSPLPIAPRATSDVVSGAISTFPLATARRCVGSFGVTSTIRARPSGSRWVKDRSLISTGQASPVLCPRSAGGPSDGDCAMITIEKFQEQGGRLKTDDIDFETFRTNPLDEHVLRCIGYMHDIEYQTVLYTRELLMMPGWKDPQFTAFLTLWNYE